jgi:phosphoribosyl 1,2-cyclic phosphodiesterase
VGVRDLAAQIVEVPFERRTNLSARLQLEAIKQIHPGGSWGYAIRHEGKRIVYATDSELDLQLLDANSITLSADDERHFPAEILQFYDDADLVIADAQYTDEEYVPRRGWGHPRFVTVVDLAVTARVRRLALFHHDPRHSDAEMDQILEQARQRARQRGSDVEIFAAAEGLALEV